MIESMISPNWYRVAGLKPGIIQQAKIQRQYFRNQLWYVLQDFSSGKFHRFTPIAHYLIAQMNSRLSLQEIWEMAVEQFADDAPTQADVIHLLNQLYRNDLLVCDIPANTLDLIQRSSSKQQQALKKKLLMPLSIRIPLFDIDKFLQRWMFLVKPIFSLSGGLIWLAFTLYACLLAGVHWSELTGNFSDRVFAPDNLIILFLVYPIIKLFHEFGHAFAVKNWGGEVHDLGMMLLIFIPVPYVDASDSSAFRDKKKRMLVGAMGIMMELFLSALALILWIELEPGLVRSIAFNIILIGSISTLFFNGNPLLRFDGYFVLSDALELPNLGARSNNYIGYLVQRYLFAVKELSAPVSSKGEQYWFVTYGLAAFIYRIFLVSTIVLFIAGQWYFVGVILAIWAIMTMVALPLFKKLKFVLVSPVIKKNRLRAINVSLLLISLISAFIFIYPIANYSRAEGVIWLNEKSHIRCEVDGFLVENLKKSGQTVESGDALFQLNDPALTAQEKILFYRLEELEAQYTSQWKDKRLEAQVTKGKIHITQADLQRNKEKQNNLQVKSHVAGKIIIPDEVDTPGRYCRQGQLLAYVVNYPLDTVRMAVTQDNIALLRKNSEKIEIRPAENIDNIIMASIVREVPAASNELPSIALGHAGGGDIAVDIKDASGQYAFESIFQFDLKLETILNTEYVGERVYIRIYHGKETIAQQLYRAGRRLFLRRFSV